MTMRKCRFRIRCSSRALTLAALLLIPKAAGAQSVEFRFDPPHGTILNERCLVGESTTQDGVETETTTSETRGTYRIRHTDSGFDVDFQPPVPDDIPFPASVKEELEEILAAGRFTYELDRNGKLVRVRGVDEVLSRISNLLPSDVMAAMSSSLGLSLNAEAAANEWNQRFMLGMFAGESVRVDSVYEIRQDFGQVRWDGTIKVSRLQDCDGRECVVIIQEKSTNAQQVIESLFASLLGIVASLAAEIQPELADSIPELPAITDGRIEQKFERALEPRTGIPHISFDTQTVRATFSGEDGGTVQVVKETGCTYSVQLP